MFVELHILQNFAPSCLNRDDTNSPKECEFGGHRRARISSQCIKRAIRDSWKNDDELEKQINSFLGKRTGLLIDELAQDLAGRQGIEHASAEKLAEAVVQHLYVKKSKRNKATEKLHTSYLVFHSQKERAQLLEYLVDNCEALQEDLKKALKENPPAASGISADIALFGRMLADHPTRNVDAACQVAHAISTNKVGMEFDFYTAVDDLNPKEQTGAGMMGTIEFNSACFYRYANIDLDQLNHNLEDEDLARKTVGAFLKAAVHAIPTGKQNSMAAQNPPSFVFGVVRNGGLWSLANAFVKPVRPTHDGSLISNSIAALENYWERLESVYGDDDIKEKCALYLEPADGKALPCVDTFHAFNQQILGAVNFNGKEQSQ
ncbi:MAG: type I-E CRISPR-associated protein Cas7/Cse4/CasC [Planctomycetes bacterium]|nr:type I-E CRISPR-associated protein Cas7/Cse4/CasC [Planctomycetota bacterium]